MYIKELKIPTWNELLGIKDNVRFRFVYEHSIKSSIYTIMHNKLLYAEDIPYEESCIFANKVMSDKLVGIEILHEDFEILYEDH